MRLYRIFETHYLTGWSKEHRPRGSFRAAFDALVRLESKTRSITVNHYIFTYKGRWFRVLAGNYEPCDTPSFYKEIEDREKPAYE